MPRADLLALTADDLAAITNRGTVKRAERELADGAPSCTLEETADELVVQWSDGIVCRFPTGKSMHEATCTSGVAGISRHVVRSVLAYQRHCRSQPTEEATGAKGGDTGSALAAQQPAAWDPGTISDEALAARYRPAAVAKARQRFAEGVLVELIRGAKPVAHFLDSACTLRFLVPNDLRYISADCDESLLATYVPLAVWAFRHLPADQAAGLVSLQQVDQPAPLDLLAGAEQLLAELCQAGIAGCGPVWPQRLTRLEEALRQAGLIWPAELAADLFHQHAMYQAHDARFDPEEVVALVGELVGRNRAIGSDTKAVPQLLVRGSPSDRVTQIAGGRMIGLGLGVRSHRHVTTLSAYVQDVDSGSLAAVERSFADPPPDSADTPKCYAELAATVLSRGVSLGGLSQSQLLLKAGKRTPSGRLVLPRTAASLTTNPQNFLWEQLKPPAAVESFAQLADRLKSLPPSYLRPRRLTDSVYVCPVQGAQEVRFNESHQRLEAVLHDGKGGQSLLIHPFHGRGRAAFDALLRALAANGGSVHFVSGHVSGSGDTLIIRPLLIVFEGADRRVGISPFIAEGAASVDSGGGDAAFADPAGELRDSEADPLESFLGQMRFELSELLVSGVRRAGHREASGWAGLASSARQVGFVRLTEPIAHLAALLAGRADAVRWDPAPAARALLQLCLLARVTSEAY